MNIKTIILAIIVNLTHLSIINCQSNSPFKRGTSLRHIVNLKATQGNGSSAKYWGSTKIIEELSPKE